MARPRQPAVLVTFAALNGDPYQRERRTGEYVSRDPSIRKEWGPVLRIVADERSDLHGCVSDLYYLCHPVRSQLRERLTAHDALAVAKDTEAALAQHLLPEVRPKFHRVTWKTDRPPNDHHHLFTIVKEKLREIRHLHPEAEIVLQLSSGTSAMHAALLVAGSAGVIPGPVRLIQSERGEGAIARPGQPFARVDFELPTVLRLAQDSAPVSAGADTAPTWAFDQARTPALRRVIDRATNGIAKSRFPLLLRGERGVGKSSLAQIIRMAGPHRSRDVEKSPPSIACGQVTDPTLLYVELCGAVRGAYTGLQRDRDGLLKQAHGDTLFLDEIHDLDHRCQRAIIRVIEEGKYTRLGEDQRVRTSRFRLITGTNQPDEVLAQRLSPDFLDRIRDLQLEIPPLRECREDLPWMWRATVQRAARDEQVSVDPIGRYDAKVLKVLARHPLPGNWRDLRRLAAPLMVEHLQNTLDDGTVSRVLDDFQQTASRSAIEARPEPHLPNARALRQQRALEKDLGEDLETLWKAVEQGRPARVVLEERLGNRYRAARALAFIRQKYPVRSGALLPNTGR